MNYTTVAVQHLVYRLSVESTTLFPKNNFFTRYHRRGTFRKKVRHAVPYLINKHYLDRNHKHISSGKNVIIICDTT